MRQENMLIEQLRNTPTELSEQAVERIIKTFPGLPLQPLEASQWKELLNLKSIIMITIPVVIAIGLLMINSTGNEATTAIETNSPVELNKETLVELPESSNPRQEVKELKKIDLEVKDLVVNDAESIEEIKETQMTPIVTAQAIPQSTSQEQDVVSVEKKKAKTKEIPEKLENNAISEPNKALVPLYPNLKPDYERAPILSDSKMKKIRRNLYNNLVEDGIVSSKTVSVEMKLPGDRIIVNDAEISPELFRKYALLTQEVKTGPNRKIKMDKKYVIIGDFNLDGFYGAGTGTFNDSLLEKGFKDKNSLDFKRKSMFDSEYKSLVEFAKSIRTPLDAKSPLFGINLNSRNAALLHDLLTTQLEEDKFLDEENKYILIQYQKEQLIVNGVTLLGDQKAKYIDIISGFNIKPKKHREILLSDKMICAGESTSGEFTGTISILE